MKNSLRRSQFPFAIFGLLAFASIARSDQDCSVKLTITSKLPYANVPFDPTIDFAKLMAEAKLVGTLDPRSISVVNISNGSAISVAVTEDLAYGDRGRLEWNIENPEHTEFEIRFRVVAHRPADEPPKVVPLIGTGDLLRYNAGMPRPIVLPYLSRLVDLTGDGRPDLVGCWNYAYRPGSPWDGIVCYPRVGEGSHFEFGDLVRMRHASQENASDLQHFTSIYMNADFADLNGDGLIDIVHSPLNGERLTLNLNTGRRDGGGMPIFAEAGSVSRPKGVWEACRAVDLNNDRSIDLVVGDQYFRNTNPQGWPIVPAEPVPLNADPRACFIDLDEDNLMDAVGLLPSSKPGPAHGARLAWRKNMGGDPPRFAPTSEALDDVQVSWCSDVAAVEDQGAVGLLVQHDQFQQVSFYERLSPLGQEPRLRRKGRAESLSAVMSLSDQAWPCVCDWNNDGVLDLLIGGGYGWPRIVINEGTRERPAFAEPQPILAEGKPIRVLMSEVFPGCEDYKHNMGYPYPVLTDWDGDGVPDLMLPNCSNRVFWYRNLGTLREPRFGPRLQLNPDGFEDTPEKRTATGQILMSRWEGEKEPGQPFFWRTGAAFADFNGDGLTDMITHDGETRKATLFVQYRDEKGALRLRKRSALQLNDGRLIDDSLVERTQHWTESFRAADWDGDGLIDLVYSCSGSSRTGSIYLLRNVGTKSEPRFLPPRTLCCFGEPIFITAHGPHPWVGDFDGDGQPDIVACVEWSVYPFYRHAAIEMKERPAYTLTPIKLR